MKRLYVEISDGIRSKWDVERIWDLAKNLEKQEVEVDKIVGIDDVTWFSKDGDQPTIRSIAGHAKRIINADLSYPPILTQDNRVFDGMHRIARSLMDGKTKIIVKKFKKNPKADLITEY